MSTAQTDQTRWFSEHVQPHEMPLRRWLAARFPSLTDRDDLVRESFVRVLRSHANTPVGNARAFLFTTARNLALNQLRHRQHERPDGLNEIDPLHLLDEKADTLESVARGQEIQILRQALQELPERCRQVFTLRRIYGLSQREISARLGISEKTVENHSALALARCVAYFRRLDTAVAPGSHAAGVASESSVLSAQEPHA